MLSLLSLSFSACAVHRWHREGATEADFRRDHDACEEQARVRYLLLDQERYEACMRARGYHR